MPFLIRFQSFWYAHKSCVLIYFLFFYAEDTTLCKLLFCLELYILLSLILSKGLVLQLVFCFTLFFFFKPNTRLRFSMEYSSTSGFHIFNLHCLHLYSSLFVFLRLLMKSVLLCFLACYWRNVAHIFMAVHDVNKTGDKLVAKSHRYQNVFAKYFWPFYS